MSQIKYINKLQEYNDENVASKDKRELNLFFSLCENGKNAVNKNKFKEALFNSGLQMFDEVKPNKSGKLASYIPPLAEVDPDRFGISIAVSYTHLTLPTKA